MSKPKLTPWIDGSVKPTRVGVYERDYAYPRPIKRKSVVVFCRWDGADWYCCSSTILGAAAEGLASDIDGAPWRGLASDPSKGAK